MSTTRLLYFGIFGAVNFPFQVAENEVMGILSIYREFQAIINDQVTMATSRKSIWLIHG